MKLIVAFLIIFVAILGTINYVNAIKCYSCSNLLGDECEKVNDGMIQDCPDMISCYKFILKSSAMNILSRSCGATTMMFNNVCVEQTQGDAKGTVCECSTDLCNSASSVAVKFVAFVPVVLAVIMKYSW